MSDYSYECLQSNSPRSFLFSVVANVGPRGASRSLAVAYRQGNDRNASPGYLPRMEHAVADTLALIEILSDAKNRAPLEAERALAEGWYRRCQGANKTESSERPSVPDTPQPPFVMPYDSEQEEEPQILPELPWHDDALSEFPFITTCLLLGLLRDGGDGDANANNSSSTRPGEVQLQPLSTVFRGDCTEYGLIVLDISDFDSGVKYGIVGFPVRYMADVIVDNEDGGWDPVEDPRLRRSLILYSLARGLESHYLSLGGYAKNPTYLRLEDRPLVDAAALDCTSVSTPPVRL
ncbi:hypothetical protein N7475_007450 [Penicillium sp. IBT 31633x]|nr:hypothetical protein N7475_007450 [Penicillium sp. IBT 31633x]